MTQRPIAEGLFEVAADGPRLIGGRRKADGVITFPMPGGSDAALYDPVRLSPNGSLWAFTVQRFPPKAPPYAGNLAAFKPFALGYVELPGEVIVEARLETDDFAGLKVGLPMTLQIVPFELASGETVASYAFRPAA